MAFWGCSFIFNGIPCEDFDLMMYDVGYSLSEEDEFASSVEPVEETIAGRWKPHFYGVQFPNKLALTIVFGVNQRRIDAGKFLDRYEIDEVASWLTGYDKYMWLEIQQSDMQYVRYRCLVTSLSTVTYGLIPWAMRMTVTCDSPYAYLYPQEFEYKINGSAEIDFFNESSLNAYYRPKLEIALSNGGDFSITNESDKDRKFSLTGVPAGAGKIYVDNDTFVITNDGGINLYPKCNYKFLRLVKGHNTLKVTGNGTLKIQCEFPVNAGG